MAPSPGVFYNGMDGSREEGGNTKKQSDGGAEDSGGDDGDALDRDGLVDEHLEVAMQLVLGRQ